MKVLQKSLVMVFTVLLMSLSGCATGPSPVTGHLITKVKGPITAISRDTKATKEGRASARSILGFMGDGDASIEAASQNGGITEIHTVDYETRVVLGIVAETTIIVTGN